MECFAAKSTPVEVYQFIKSCIAAFLTQVTWAKNPIRQSIGAA